jgi:hypothetical protein
VARANATSLRIASVPIHALQGSTDGLVTVSLGRGAGSSDARRASTVGTPRWGIASRFTTNFLVAREGQVGVRGEVVMHQRG